MQIFMSWGKIIFLWLHKFVDHMLVSTYGDYIHEIFISWFGTIHEINIGIPRKIMNSQYIMVKCSQTCLKCCRELLVGSWCTRPVYNPDSLVLLVIWIQITVHLSYTFKDHSMFILILLYFHFCFSKLGICMCSD